jgi:hypothetical protein
MIDDPSCLAIDHGTTILASQNKGTGGVVALKGRKYNNKECPSMERT